MNFEIIFQKHKILDKLVNLKKGTTQKVVKTFS